MKQLIRAFSLLLCIFLAACGNTVIENDAEKETKNMYQQITPEEAKKLMDSENNYIILDVRDPQEFESGHIPGAVLIPHTKIDEQAENIIPEKDKLILVYCRSGRRSKIAAESLVSLGYTNVKEFGGILQWPYETE